MRFAASPSHRAASRIAVCLLALQGCLLAWSALRNSPTVDEPAHLAAGISHWTWGTTDLYAVNPPLVRMTAAIPMLFAQPETRWNAYRKAEETRAEFEVGEAFMRANGERIFWLMTLARWACIPFVLLGGWYCRRWAEDLYGTAAGLLALVLWCFSPTVLAHGALITADAASASFGIMAAYYFWRWLKVRQVREASVAGLALGLALLVKSTLMLYGALWPVIWLAYRAAGRETWPRDAVLREGAQGALLLGIAILSLNLGYGFEGTFRRLDSFRFRSRALTGSVSDESAPFGNRFEGSLLGAVRVPVPANYLIGIDRQRLDFEEGKVRYLRGEVRRPGEPGWRWFYAYAAAVKVPLGTWVLALVALPVALSRGGRDQIALVVPAAAIVALVSSQTGMSFFRYLLPAFPFAFIWIAQAAEHIRAGRWIPVWIGCGAAAWMIFSSLAVFPHSLSYFNELVGGPRQGFRVLDEANADWGQDLIFLREWIAAHPDAAGLELDYYGEVDPIAAGLNVRTEHRGARFESEGDLADVASQAPQWYAVSVTRLVRRAVQPDAVHARYLLTREPEGRAGYSILIYRVARR